MKRINKYLFLDVDGVLNSVSWYRAEWNKDHVYPQGDFDPKCVEIVNRIVKETGCKVVVSSSWRAEINLQSIFDKAAEVAIIKKLRDQRIDNAEQYRMAGRQDLYDNEMAESLILNEFLPEVPDDKVLALGLVEVCTLQGCEDGPKIPKSKMGIIIKELKAMFPAADGKQIADLVKSCVV